MEKIYITKNDHKKLTDLIIEKRVKTDDIRELSKELERAIVIEPEKMPNDVITMNSLVVFSDIHSGSELKYQLVFPNDADIVQNKISVLSPIGCALLGYKIGDVITIKTPKGDKRYRIEKILYQPEAEGNYE